MVIHGLPVTSSLIPWIFYAMPAMCSPELRSATLEKKVSEEFVFFAGGYRYPILLSFRAICHHHPRDENLLRALHCLHDKRLMTMLHFHIAKECPQGLDILTNLTKRNAKLMTSVITLPITTDALPSVVQKQTSLRA